MSGVNKVILIGNLGKDPEIKHAANGTTIANMTVATSETWRDKQTGEKQESTEWHRVVFFGKVAEIVETYLTKGSKVYVEGKLQTRKWQDQSGQDRYTTEIVGSQMQMLGSKNEPTSSGYRETKPDQRGIEERAQASFDDDIPF